MALVIGPYTVRNYRLSHRLIPVNAQDGYQFWALSVKTDPGGHTLRWPYLWKERGEPIFKRVTGHPYSLELTYEHAVALNDAFRAEALRNFRDPGAVAVNLLRNLQAFNAGAGTWWIHYLREGRAGSPTVRLPEVMSAAILLLGLAGAVGGLRDGNTDARVVTVIYLVFFLAHSMTFLLPRYDYVRLPLAMLALPLLWRGNGKVASILAVLLAVLTAASTVVMFTDPASFREALRRPLTAIR